MFSKPHNLCEHISSTTVCDLTVIPQVYCNEAPSSEKAAETQQWGIPQEACQGGFPREKEHARKETHFCNPEHGRHVEADRRPTSLSPL